MYLKGLKDNDISYFRAAKFIFPFEKDILVGEALVYLRSKIVGEQVYSSLKDALVYDPYSAEMLGMYIQYANYYGNKNEAKLAYKKLERIAPNSNVLKELRKINPKGY